MGHHKLNVTIIEIGICIILTILNLVLHIKNKACKFRVLWLPAADTKRICKMQTTRISLQNERVEHRNLWIPPKELWGNS